MVQQLMVMKQASRSISRVENEKGLLGGQMISTSDLDFVINEVRDIELDTLNATDLNFRTWSTSPSPQLGVVMQDGL